MNQRLLNLHDEYFSRIDDPVAASLMVLADILHVRKTGNVSETLTVNEAAEFLKVTSKTIYRLCNSEKVRSMRVGSGRGTLRINRRDLERIAS